MYRTSQGQPHHEEQDDLEGGHGVSGVHGGGGGGDGRSADQGAGPQPAVPAGWPQIRGRANQLHFHCFLFSASLTRSSRFCPTLPCPHRCCCWPAPQAAPSPPSEVACTTAPAAPGRTLVAVVGDSITFGFNCRSWRGGYVKVLQDTLGNATYDVRDCGHNGLDAVRQLRHHFWAVSRPFSAPTHPIPVRVPWSPYCPC